MKRLILFWAIAVLLQGCMTVAPTTPEPPVVEDISVGKYPSHYPATKPESSNAFGSAFEQLMADARQAIELRDYPRAAALAERAMRISPQDPRAYFELAKISFYQNNIDRSRALLARAESLAASDGQMLSTIQQFSQRNLR